MELLIITPKKTETITVAWMEVQTKTGNRIIQSGHAPMLFVLQPNYPFTYAPLNVPEQSIMVPSGTLEVERERATLLLHEK